MTQDKKIIDRIRKLLAMAEGGTIHEKETAIFQAQRLMAKHHIEEYQVRDFEKEKVVKIMSPIVARKKTWALLASVIAFNFRCKSFAYIYSPTKIFPVFLGFETDALVAKEIFEKAYNFASKEVNNIAAYHSYHYGTAKGVRDEWLVGFVEGLKAGFEAQVDISSETTLMIVTPQEVEDEHNKMNWMKPERVPKDLEIRRNYDKDLNRAGYQNGYEFAHGRKQQALQEERDV